MLARQDTHANRRRSSLVVASSILLSAGLVSQSQHRRAHRSGAAPVRTHQHKKLNATATAAAALFKQGTQSQHGRASRGVCRWVWVVLKVALCDVVATHLLPAVSSYVVHCYLLFVVWGKITSNGRMTQRMALPWRRQKKQRAIQCSNGSSTKCER